MSLFNKILLEKNEAIKNTKMFKITFVVEKKNWKDLLPQTLLYSDKTFFCKDPFKFQEGILSLGLYILMFIFYWFII